MWPKVKTKNKPIDKLVLAERRALLEQAKQGCNTSFVTYFRMNKGLFEKIIRQYSSYVIPDRIDDMRQEAFVGLLKGIQAYDPAKAVNTKPEGYVFSWVRAYVANFARTHGLVASNDTISHSIHDDEDEGILDQMADEAYVSPHTQFEDAQFSHLMQRATKRLLPKERAIVERRTLADEPDTLENIGKDLGVSRERIRQIEIEVKEKLRRRYERGELVG
jgi:RNA polymerase sigma factor (sigma-70 family)